MLPVADTRTGVTRLIAAAFALLMLAGCTETAASERDRAEATTAASTQTATAATEDSDTTPFDGITFLSDAADYVGASTATLADEAITPVASPTPSLPVTVTSHAPDGDEEVTVTDASRIVVLDIAGSIGGTVYGLGLGDSIVGRDVAAEIPGLEDVPVVTGSSHSVNVEAILALNPTVVLTDGTIGPRSAVAQLADAGVAVVFLDNESSFDGAAQLARDVAAALGVSEAGELLADQITAEVDQVSAAIAEITPDEPLRMAFLYLRGDSGIYYLFGEGSGADELIAALGGVDAAAEAGIEGEQPLTDEAMLAADPDLILVMTSGLESVGGVDGLLASKPAIALTTAGQNSRFVDMADTEILSFGPRSADVLEALAVAVYAPEQ